MFPRQITATEALRLNADRQGTAWFVMGEDANGRVEIKHYTYAN